MNTPLPRILLIAAMIGMVVGVPFAYGHHHGQLSPSTPKQIAESEGESHEFGHFELFAIVHHVETHAFHAPVWSLTDDGAVKTAAFPSAHSQRGPPRA